LITRDNRVPFASRVGPSGGKINMIYFYPCLFHSDLELTMISILSFQDKVAALQRSRRANIDILGNIMVVRECGMTSLLRVDETRHISQQLKSLGKFQDSKILHH
jgi:transcriptional antiterminator Rof (Rho-off)